MKIITDYLGINMYKYVLLEYNFIFNHRGLLIRVVYTMWEKLKVGKFWIKRIIDW